MTDRSLFPDIAPDTTPTPPRPSCCDDLAPPPDVPDRVWTYTHALCHSRVPFTLPGFVAVAECTDRQGHRAIVAARGAGWLHPVWPEPYMTDPITQWVGCLPRRR